MGGPSFITGNKKRCMGPLHQGEYIPLDEFYRIGSGRRKGRPFSQCKACHLARKRADTRNQMILYSRVEFVFQELHNRLGKMETCRRLGVAPSFFSRRKHEGLKKIQRETVIKAMRALKECREKGEVRHRNSIRRGATIRGEKEKIPVKKRHYYNTTYDSETKDRKRIRKDTI
jgi:hypothetical protein